MNMKSSFFAGQSIYIIWRKYVQLGSSFLGFLVLCFFFFFFFGFLKFCLLIDYGKMWHGKCKPEFLKDISFSFPLIFKSKLEVACTYMCFCILIQGYSRY
jgi:hypothetical protein